MGAPFLLIAPTVSRDIKSKFDALQILREKRKASLFSESVCSKAMIPEVKVIANLATCTHLSRIGVN